MPSKVDIGNRALSKLGENLTITSFSDGTPPANAISANFDMVRDDVLRDHPWNCLMTRAQLAPETETPAWGFDYQYQLPSDCLRVVEVEALTSQPKWRVEGRKILTDDGPVLNIVYLKREEDPNEYDSQLVEALATRLALELCETFTQSNTKKDYLYMAYNDVLRQARRSDAQEGTPTVMLEDSWLSARR